MKIEHIAIYANDVDTLAKWYCEVLNLKVARKLERSGRLPVYFLEGTQATIEILPTDKVRKEREIDEPGFSHIGLTVEDFKETEMILKTKGVALHGVRDTSAGWRIGYFNDPEGNVMEIIER